MIREQEKASETSRRTLGNDPFHCATVMGGFFSYCSNADWWKAIFLIETVPDRERRGCDFVRCPRQPEQPGAVRLSQRDSERISFFVVFNLHVMHKGTQGIRRSQIDFRWY